MKFYTLPEVSEILRTSVSRIRLLIKRHKLLAILIDRKYIVDEKDLKDFIYNSKGCKSEIRSKVNE